MFEASRLPKAAMLRPGAARPRGAIGGMLERDTGGLQEFATATAKATILP